MACPWLAVYVCFKQCVRTLVLMGSDTWLYSSSVLVPCSEKLSCCDIDEKLRGMGVGWVPFTYCLEGLRLVCGKWLPSLSPLCSFRHVVRTITTICIYFPEWVTSVGHWKGKWGCGRDQIFGPWRPQKSYLVLYCMICVPVLCSSLAWKFFVGPSRWYIF